ncbi:MAG: hypothetical protein ABWX94_03220 [Candidatus Saccharimonadales bacterium]
MKEGLFEQSPLEATLAQTLHVAGAAELMGIKHTVVCDARDQPIAVHLPGLVHPGLAEDIATSAANVLFEDKNANLHVRNEPTIFPRSRLTGRPYPLLLGGFIHEAAIAAFNRPGFVCDDLQTVEEGRGDGVPHIDLMERLESPDAEELGLNIHVTLAGEGTFRGAIIPDFGAVRELAEGIQACYQEIVRKAISDGNGMDMNDCVIRVRHELIRAHQIMVGQAEGAIHPALRAGAVILHTALQEASPTIKLSPGDVLVFQGAANQARNCVPIVHDFDTTSPYRYYTAFRPRMIAKDVSERENTKSDADRYVADSLFYAGIAAPGIPQQPYRF